MPPRFLSREVGFKPRSCLPHKPVRLEIEEEKNKTNTSSKLQGVWMNRDFVFKGISCVHLCLPGWHALWYGRTLAPGPDLPLGQWEELQLTAWSTQVCLWNSLLVPSGVQLSPHAGPSNCPAHGGLAVDSPPLGSHWTLAWILLKHKHGHVLHVQS